jgi:hypothetical protein
MVDSFFVPEARRRLAGDAIHWYLHKSEMTDDLVFSPLPVGFPEGQIGRPFDGRFRIVK